MSSDDDTPGSGGLPPLSSSPTLPPTATQYRLPKSPGLAVILSFFPGLGQVYNGQAAKALVFFFGWVGSIYGAAEISPLPFGLLIPFVYLYNLVDAYRSAALINARFLGQGRLPEDDVAESPAWGATLIGMGLLLLLHNLNWLNLAAFSRYWPVVLIVAGAAMLRGSLKLR